MSFTYQSAPRIMSGPSFHYQDPNMIMFKGGQPTLSTTVPVRYPDHSLHHSNSYRSNRIAPQQLDYSTYSQSNTPVRSTSAIQSTKTLLTQSQIYSMQQPFIHTNNPYDKNQSYYPENNLMSRTQYSHSDGDFRQRNQPTTWWSQPLCFGLTRLSGGFFFGIMLVLGIGSFAGIITTGVLYALDPNSSSQWKVLGIIVCVVMFVTVIATFLAFIYCYKKGRVATNDNNNNFSTPEHNQDDESKAISNFVRSSYMSPVPYEMMHNSSSLSANDDIIRIADKQTNTETTMAPLRVRDIQRGVWPGLNAYGGIANRPLKKPKTVNHYVQTISQGLDQPMIKANGNSIYLSPRGLVEQRNNHHPYEKELNPSHFLDTKNKVGKLKGHYDEDHTRSIELVTQDGKSKEKRKHKYTNVSVVRIKPDE